MAGDNEKNELRDIFLTHGTEIRLKKGEYMLEKGSPSTEMWYILKGTVRAFCTGYDGEDITVFYISEDNIIYYESLAQDARVIQSAQAVTPMVVYSLSSDKFLEFFRPSASNMGDFMKHILDRVILLHENIMCTRFPEGKKRVAYFLCCTYKRSGPDLKITNEQIAAITGINRVSVNRILNEFSKAGMLSKGYRNIHILDSAALVAVFDSVGLFSTQ